MFSFPTFFPVLFGPILNSHLVLLDSKGKYTPPTTNNNLFIYSWLLILGSMIEHTLKNIIIIKIYPKAAYDFPLLACHRDLVQRERKKRAW